MKNIARFISVAATVCGLSLWAQDDDVEDDATTTTETTADGGEEADVGIDIGGQIHHSKSEPKFFYTLPKVEKLEGSASVLKPGARDWESALEGRFYPLGSVFRTSGSATRLTVALGRDCSVVVAGEASFGTRGQGLDVKSRAILLKSGTITVDLPRNLPEGLFFVEAPGFSVLNPAGKSTYRYVKTGDGDKATIRCVTGSLAIEGLHFKILSMRAANEVCIQTSQDALFTGISELAATTSASSTRARSRSAMSRPASRTPSRSSSNGRSPHRRRSASSAPFRRSARTWRSPS